MCPLCGDLVEKIGKNLIFLQGTKTDTYCSVVITLYAIGYYDDTVDVVSEGFLRSMAS